MQKLVEVTGLSNDTIRFYLHDKFKQANPWEGSHAIPTPLLEKAEKNKSHQMRLDVATTLSAILRACDFARFTMRTLMSVCSLARFPIHKIFYVS